MKFILKSKRKKFFFGSTIIALLLSLYIFINSILLSAIIQLINVKERLGRYYITHSNFTLAEHKEQIRRGKSEKYVFRDQQGRKWLFKFSAIANENGARTCWQMSEWIAQILGVKVPESFRLSVYINGQKRDGFIYPFIPTCETIYFRDGNAKDTLPCRKYFIYDVFSWLVGIPQYDIELIITPQKEIYQADITNSRFQEVEGLANVDKLIQQKSPQSPSFLHHLALIDETIFKEYIADKELKLSNHLIEGPLEFFLDRRQHLLNSIVGLEDIRKHRSFPNKLYALKYRLKLCKDLIRDIIKKLSELAFIGKQKKDSELIIIASPDAWSVLTTYFNDLRSVDIPKLQELEKQLFLLRHHCQNLYEKIAITLYIRQVRMLEEYVRRHGKMEKIHLDYMFAQVLCTVKEFQLPHVNTWFFSAAYQSETNQLMNSLKGENDYILGLLSFINKNFAEAKQLLKKAQKLGYTVSEIEDILGHNKKTF
jgi:hypothetical protein